MDWKGCTSVVEIKVAAHVLYTQTSSKRTRAGVRRKQRDDTARVVSVMITLAPAGTFG